MAKTREKSVLVHNKFHKIELILCALVVNLAVDVLTFQGYDLL